MSNWIKAHKLQFGLGILVIGTFMLLIAMIFSTATSVSAAPLPQREPPSNETCLFCHQDQALSVEIGGQSLSLFIDGGRFSESVHAMEEIACADCHSNIRSFPHPEVTASSPRDFSLEMYTTCQQCHGEQ